ncbi:glycosyltransferase family A protein [Actinomycetaceae bacterium MB13-C1-2]|nr:glycosyltransferase family A protein [Actinomycetaceae bacterium MB13-C1-2]
MDHPRQGVPADQLKIGVAIPCRNDAQFLGTCLEALARQTRKPSFIVVVDNSSDDKSAQVAHDGGAVVVEQSQIGIWPAASMAYDEIAKRGADVIARLDADSVPPPDWIERIERAFTDDPTLLAITGMGDFYGGTRFSRWFGKHCYLGLMVSIMNPWLGNPVLFGSNSAMSVALWERMKNKVLSNRADIHDDFELSIRMRPSDNAVYDETLRVGVSARPFDGPHAFATRIGKALRTMRVTWPEILPWWRRHHDY